MPNLGGVLFDIGLIAFLAFVVIYFWRRGKARKLDMSLTWKMLAAGTVGYALTQLPHLFR